MRRVIVAAVAAALAAAPAAQAAKTQRVDGPKGISVDIRTTTGGVPHIRARDFRSLGFGLGLAQGRDVMCPLADAFVTVNAERSRYFGPDGAYDQVHTNETAPNNLRSDLFYAKLNAQRVVERQLAAKGAPDRRLKRMAAGYALGYNAALERQTDPACKGKPWVKSIKAIDVWRRVNQLLLIASSGVAIDGITKAEPPTAAVIGRTAQAAAALPLLEEEPALGGLGSNAIALGSEATRSGRGMLLGNPHFPWQGAQRFHQAQLTVPGKLDVSGSLLLGAPIVVNGFTRGLTWSHTVSVARRFAVYEVPLVAGKPTAYTVDGRERRMQRTDVAVTVRRADGSLGTERRTFYDTEYGPVLTEIQGLPIFPWTVTSAYTLFDANANGLGRLANHYFRVNRAQSVRQLDRIARELQGLPWVNTVAADAKGNAYYADIGAMPNIDVDRYATCQTPLGRVADQQARLAVLDGSKTSCAPGRAAGAAAPGLLPPSRQPSAIRRDYTENSNDSYWLVNARFRLEGFSRIIGTEGSARLLRTRYGIKMVEDRLAGRDGLPGNRWTVPLLKQRMLDDHNYAGELWRDELLALCRAEPTLVGSNGPVDVSAACPALAQWDLREDVGSRGALLFRRFASHVFLDADAGDPWRPSSYDRGDPVNTPNGLNTNEPKVRRAFADAVDDLRSAGIPFDAPLGDHAFVVRNGERIAIHGGPGVGAFNLIQAPFAHGSGFGEVEHGTSYLQVVEVTGRCPNAHTLMAYSQSTDPTSKHFADQTRRYSRREWIDLPFCEREIRRDPALAITRVR